LYYFQTEILAKPDVIEKNGLHICVQRPKIK